MRWFRCTCGGRTRRSHAPAGSRGASPLEPATGIAVERLSGDEDLDAVAALEARCFVNAWTRDMLARELFQSDVARLYVLRTPEARVAAYCACWLIVDELHINKLAVDPLRRRHGLALRLVRHVCAEAAAEGATRATLEVRRSNHEALGLYRRLGFEVGAVRPRYYTQPDEDGFILWREGLMPKPDA